ncbi:MAG: PHP domain-containing protein, partial [Lachnospiraceae bacterium]|nr:PHP domain-containing protein [Lachnospiraceae bacterium]
MYDDFLRLGKKIYCIGADDNHNDRPDHERRSDSGWAWTQIKADKLDYESISEALLKGHFYASEGPEIYDLYVEDGKVHITCSPAERVTCLYEQRVCGAKFAEIGGEPVTEVAFDAK